MSLNRLRDQAALATGNFGRLFGRLELPPLPGVATRLLALMRSEDVEFSDLATVIASDAGIATRVLRTVNAAGVGLSRQITDIQQAISVLGLNRIRDLVLAYAALDALPRESPGFEYQDHWQAAVQRAVFAQVFAARRMPGTEGEAFTGALLQDMAVPLLLDRWGQDYLPIMEAAEKEDRELVEVEEEQLSWTHAQAGAWMASNWGFPDALVCSIGLHHATLEQIDELELTATPIRAVAISSKIPGQIATLPDDLGIDLDEWDAICTVTDDSCGAVAGMLQLAPPAPLLGPV